MVLFSYHHRVHSEGFKANHENHRWILIRKHSLVSVVQKRARATQSTWYWCRVSSQLVNSLWNWRQASFSQVCSYNKFQCVNLQTLYLFRSISYERFVANSTQHRMCMHGMFLVFSTISLVFISQHKLKCIYTIKPLILTTSLTLLEVMNATHISRLPHFEEKEETIANQRHAKQPQMKIEMENDRISIFARSFASLIKFTKFQVNYGVTGNAKYQLNVFAGVLSWKCQTM